MTIRILFFVLTTLLLVCCKRQGESISNSVSRSDNLDDFSAGYFVNIDTSEVGQSKGCSNGIYKLVSDRYVIRLLLDIPIKSDSCYTISIDSLEGKPLAELFIFDNMDASLTNICSDVIVANHPKPSRKIYAKSGQFTVAFTDPTAYYGNATYHTTVLITELVFIDSAGEKIELENELIWKVLSLGTIG